MASNIMRNTDFRAIVEPILNEEFDGVYDQRKDEYLQVFKVRTGIPRDRHEEPVLFGFGAAPELPEGMPVTYQAGGTLWLKEYIYKRYGLAFALTSTLIEDGDHIRIGSVYSQHLAQSLIETKETLTANVINNSFNNAYPGGDGVSFINANHPIAVGSFSNTIAASALSQTSVEQMLIQIRTNGVDNNQKKIHLDPASLVVSPANEFQAEVIVKSVLRAGTANNDLNPVKSRGYLNKGVAVITRLTSPTAWYVHNDNPDMKGLQVVMRSPLKKSMEGDFETDSFRYKAIERYDVGFTDPRAMFGNAGQ